MPFAPKSWKSARISGAGFDGDADRCGFVDDKGEIIPMDLFTALIAQDILSEKGQGTVPILYDLRSSWAVRECIQGKRWQTDHVPRRTRFHQSADAGIRRRFRG